MRATQKVIKKLLVIVITFAALFLLIYHMNERYTAANLELEERALLAELGCENYSSSEDLSSVRYDLMNNELSTESVTAKYRKCDAKLRGEIRSRRTTSATNLAFSISLHRDVAILESQLKVLFRPNHAFCLHVDAKAEESVFTAVWAMVDCYKKVWPRAMLVITSEPISIYWGHISQVDAELKCFELLKSMYSNWTHLLNLAGSELPIQPIGKIEQEIEEILNSDQSFVESGPMPESNRRKIDVRHVLGRRPDYKWHPGYELVPLPQPGILKDTPPHNLVIFKGIKNAILSRSMVHFLLNSTIAIKFRDWLEDTLSPDEYFFATMVRVNLDADTGEVSQDLRPSIARRDMCHRYTLWQDGRDCHGKYKRQICNIGLLDLPLLRSGPASTCLVVNKFDLNVDPLAVSCWTQHLLREEGIEEKV